MGRSRSGGFPGKIRTAFAIAVLTASIQSRGESPCAGVDRTLAPAGSAAFAAEVAGQLHVKKAEVTQSFRERGWTILLVSTGEADDAYLFYAHDPLRSRYVTLWAGAATSDEEPAIRAWVGKHAPGIPRKLAGCFAWHVTKER